MRRALLLLSLLGACRSGLIPRLPNDATTPRDTATVDIVDASAAADTPVITAEILPRSRLDTELRPLIDDGWLAGAIVGIVDPRGAQLAGYGVAIEGTARPPDGDTLFEIGSITKTLTSLVLAEDVAAGTFPLDTPVQSLLPASTRVPTGRRAITLRDLSVHGSGLPRLATNLNPADPQNPYADYTVDDLDAFLSAYTLPREPGASFEYSNLAVGLLGRALAHRASSTLEALLRDRIFVPLGMRDTSIALSDERRARLATPHDFEGTTVRSWEATDATAGAGAVRSTARDMLRYGAAIAGTDPTTAPLTRAIELSVREQQRWPDRRMGLGWFFTDDGRLWHNGGTGGFESVLVVDREQRRAVLVLANTNSPWQPITNLGLRLSSLARGENPAPLGLPRRVEVAPATLARYVGVYRMEASPSTTITVAMGSGGLTARLSGQSAFRITPSSETGFFFRVAVARLHFEADSTGAWTRVRLDQNGRSQWARRS